jgi:hypothetical protein
MDLRVEFNMHSSLANKKITLIAQSIECHTNIGFPNSLSRNLFSNYYLEK